MISNAQKVRIRKLKKEGYSVKQIAEQAGVSMPTVSRYTKRLRHKKNAEISPGDEGNMVDLLLRLSDKELALLGRLFRAGVIK